MQKLVVGVLTVLAANAFAVTNERTGAADRGKSALSPAHCGVWVDAAEVVRKDGRQAERDRLAGEVERHVAETTGFETALRAKAQTALPDASRIRKGRWTEVWPRVEPGVSLRGALPLVTNAVEGEIWSDAFEETLRRAGALRIPARSEPYYIDRALVLSPGQSVVATGAEIRMKPGSGACMLRNAHVVGMTDQKSLAIPDVPYDREILVEGGLWFGLRTAREAMNGNADATCPKERPVHGCHGAFVFNHVRSLVIRNATVGGCLTHAFQFSDVHDFLVKDVTVRAPTRDGVHFHGGCDWGVVSGVRGASWDDFVALNAWDWSHTAPVVGPIHHLLVERVVGRKDGSRAIRLLCGNRKKRDGSGGTVACGVSDVVLRDLTDIREFKAYDQPNLELGRDKDRSEPIGTLRNIFVHDLLLHTPGRIEIDNHVDGFDVSRVRFAFEPKPAEEAVVVVGPKTAKWGTVEIFSPDEDIAVKGLSVDDVVVEKTGRKIAPEKAVKVSKAGKGRVMFK